MSYTYLLLNVLTISFPLVRSFEPRVHFVSRWRYLLPAILLTGAVFIVWDEWFTQMGVWSFNPKYLSGIYLLSLPLEEWLFFLTVPFACTFIYEVLIYFFPKTPKISWVRPFTAIIAVGFLVVGILYRDRYYTGITFTGAGVWLLINLFTLPAVYQFRMWSAYAVSLLPFFLVNGLLTSLPVVEYNDQENLGIRVWSIPLDDFVYGLFLLWMTQTIYEWLRRRKHIHLN